MVAARIPLNYMSSFNLTPLQGLLKEFSFRIEIRYLERELLYWLQILRSYDVDLEYYGKKVMCLFNLIKSKDLKWPSLRSNLPYCRFYPRWTEVHLIGFKYGHRLEDWRFWFSEPTDRIDGEFWSLIEDSPLATFIPGAWAQESPCI
ncbi:uncharacterized protein EAF01_004541 [Botrytis porri]|uniref:uncharacterized protein n=1 Tax=Botrytis porri TaxID=87229 RepID=UPI00190154A2|nr:uncharacterized protein EAF01_004541 [Botrytis porri]KAF7908786.1 hypothetical protein EAF01_004541 [Botrytis porri]